MFSKIFSRFSTFFGDDTGASLLEYTVLIALITVGVVASVTSVGGWATTTWGTLKTSLGL